MKRWTVMLIPHDRGSGTRSLNIHAYQVWVVAVLFVVLSFSSAFLLQRYRTLSGQVDHLQRTKAKLERDFQNTAASQGQETEEEHKAIEQLRAEFERRERAITEDLREVYEFENEARELQGLPARVQKGLKLIGGPETEKQEDGQGGPPGEVGDALEMGAELAALRAPHFIYGLSRPSADMIRLEIALRRESLRDLVDAMKAKAERLARQPNVFPIKYTRITSRFGYRRDPFTGKRSFHSGIDITGPSGNPVVGTPVVATGKGEVIDARREAYYGNVVRIDHGNGIVTVYAHLNSLRVKQGDKVVRHQPIGTLGSTGRSTGPHVHYEVRVNGKAANPEKYLFKD